MCCFLRAVKVAGSCCVVRMCRTWRATNIKNCVTPFVCGRHVSLFYLGPRHGLMMGFSDVDELGDSRLARDPMPLCRPSATRRGTRLSDGKLHHCGKNGCQGKATPCLSMRKVPTSQTKQPTTAEFGNDFLRSNVPPDLASQRCEGDVRWKQQSLVGYM